MPTFQKIVLSGSTSGKPIAVVATATAGTLIHTAISTALGLDEVWLWVENVTGSAATLTLEWGGVATADQAATAVSIPANSGPILIAPGLLLTGGLIIRAFSGTASALNISGYTNRIS